MALVMQAAMQAVMQVMHGRRSDAEACGTMAHAMGALHVYLERGRRVRVPAQCQPLCPADRTRRMEADGGMALWRVARPGPCGVAVGGVSNPQVT